MSSCTRLFLIALVIVLAAVASPAQVDHASNIPSLVKIHSMRLRPELSNKTVRIAFPGVARAWPVGDTAGECDSHGLVR